MARRLKPTVADAAPVSPRVLVFSGKGGVGKTTVAAATGLRSARLGHRTLVLSVDVAHSLADAFDVTEALADHPRGTPFPVEDRLWIQEIDVQQEVERHWEEVFRYMSALFAETGLDGVVAEELALIPGMEDVVALLYLNDYVRDRTYDVIVLDLAPTGESLRFVSMPNTLDWYMRRVFRFERAFARIARPVAKGLAGIPLPGSAYFREIEALWARMQGVDKVLSDPEITCVRLVTNAEKMVVKETERAHMYFSLYGVSVDGIIVNRVIADLPDAAQLPPSLGAWSATHRRNLERIRAAFAPLPITIVPLQPDEVVGIKRLAALGNDLYGPVDGGQNPAARTPVEPPYRLETARGHMTVKLRLPNLDKRALDLHVEQDELIVRVGSQKRHVPLPRRLKDRAPETAAYEDGWLTVTFRTGAADARGEKTKKPPAERHAA